MFPLFFGAEDDAVDMKLPLLLYESFGFVPHTLWSLRIQAAMQLMMHCTASDAEAAEVATTLVDAVAPTIVTLLSHAPEYDEDRSLPTVDAIVKQVCRIGTHE